MGDSLLCNLLILIALNFYIQMNIYVYIDL